MIVYTMNTNTLYMRMNMLRCHVCRGSKKVAPMGGIYVSCPACKGVGHYNDVPVVNPNIEPKINHNTSQFGGPLSPRKGYVKPTVAHSIPAQPTIPAIDTVARQQSVNALPCLNDALALATNDATMQPIVQPKKRQGMPKGGWPKKELSSSVS